MKVDSPPGGAHSRGALLGLGVVSALAQGHGVSEAQVLYRWAYQRGMTVITGGSSREHMKENLDLFRFQLSEEEMWHLDHAIPADLASKTYGPLPEEIL